MYVFIEINNVNNLAVGIYKVNIVLFINLLLYINIIIIIKG